MAKSTDHEIKVTVIYKKYKVTRSVKLNKYQKYDAYLLDYRQIYRQKSMGHIIEVKASCGSVTERT